MSRRPSLLAYLTSADPCSTAKDKMENSFHKSCATLDTMGSSFSEIDDPAFEIRSPKISRKKKRSEPRKKFHKLLNLDPSNKNGSFKEERVVKMLKVNPELAALQYKFEAFHCMTYPFQMLCALGASQSTLELCLMEFPEAVAQADWFVGSSLHYACMYQPRLETIAYLVEIDPYPISVAAGDDNHMPLHLACAASAPLNVLEFLIAQDPETTKHHDVNGRTPLHLYCNRESVHCSSLACLIASNPNACKMQSEDGATPLHNAVRVKAPTSILKQLIKTDTTALKLRDGQGCIPLSVAVEVESGPQIIELLVESCAPDKDSRPGCQRAARLMAMSKQQNRKSIGVFVC